tara:strand:- start:58534 stop:58821 length:288 start_codon:yes stop_codon:yes gene_type:complete
MTSAEVRERLGELPGWELRADKLVREFRFPDFNAAFAFMTRCALRAEQLDHHPEWCNVYNRVRVELTTHDAGGITDRDFMLAAAMQDYAAASAGS